MMATLSAVLGILASPPLPALDLSAKSALIMDADSGIVIWSKDADTPRPPASTTKVMTGLLLLERTLPTDMVVAPKDVGQVKESSMNLKPGEKLSSLDLLYGIMLRSANDGCYAAAVHIAGSVPKFAELMNARAKQIGCRTASFKNPHGLTQAGHVLSARDLALIGREAMKFKTFREVVKSRTHPIVRSINQGDKLMVNRNRYLRKDPTADGIKTGFTTPARQCYVGSATRKGYRLITVILKSEGYRKDHAAMLDWGYKNFSPFTWYDKDALVSEPELADGRKVEALADAPVRAMKGVNGVEPRLLRVEVAKDRKSDADPLGWAVAEYPSGETFRFPLRQGRTVSTKFAAAGLSPSVLAAGGAMLIGASLLRRKARKESFYARPTSGIG